MLTCPNCQKKNLHGAIFCQDCGVQLVFGNGEMIARNPEQTSTPAVYEPAQTTPANSDPPAIQSDSLIALYIQETGQILSIRDREEITLGRAIEGQSIIPDFDLTPYNGYEKGVSRLHASIRIDGNKVTVTDLGSANGTRVNGSKLTPNQPQPVAQGDMLSLGKLNIQVFIRS